MTVRHFAMFGLLRAALVAASAAAVWAVLSPVFGPAVAMTVACLVAAGGLLIALRLLFAQRPRDRSSASTTFIHVESSSAFIAGCERVEEALLFEVFVPAERFETFTSDGFFPPDPRADTYLRLEFMVLPDVDDEDIAAIADAWRGRHVSVTVDITVTAGRRRSPPDEETHIVIDGGELGRLESHPT